MRYQDEYEIAADGFAALRALIRQVVEEVIANRQGKRARDRRTPLISIEDVARRLDVSDRHVHYLKKHELMPKEIRLGGCVRWNPDEIEAWIAAGCPTQEQWEASKNATSREGGQ